MLCLSEDSKDKLIKHAKDEAPNEACGILAGPPPLKAGQDRQVEKVFQMTNTDKSSLTFFMDPKEQLKVFKEMRNLGLEMKGIYHSHLASEAYPSRHDVELALYPEVSYVIVSIKEKDNPRIRSFKIIEGKITEEDVEIK